MNTDKTFYITTPIYYVNGDPHMGHAYTTIACDVLARFKKLDGYKTYFLTGTDEHGQKVHQSAEAAGVTPQDFCDKTAKVFKELAEFLNCEFDDFIRTTEDRHKKGAKALWTKLEEQGHIYLGKYAGWYSVRDETFFAEDELVDGKAPTGADVEWVEEPSYFFKLSEFQDRLLQLYDLNPGFIMPTARRNEITSFVKSGLKDLSISRTTFKWGIPVPGADDHVMYVWIDALTNYMTALGYPDESADLYKTFWPADVHMVGKDIQRFHCVIWPALLMAAGLDVPKRVFSHGWWLNEGQKMSKSVGNVLEPYELVEKYGLDALRYYVLREVPFGQDGNFSHETMVARKNGELSNDLGNLVQRTMSFVYKHCNGKIPEVGEFTTADQEILQASDDCLENVRRHLDDQAFHKALEEIWRIIGAANRYIDEQAPWTLRKSDLQRMQTVLYVLADIIRRVGLLVQPFMPDSATKVLAAVGVKAAKPLPFDQFQQALKPGAAIPEPKPIFPRYEEAEKDSSVA